MSAAWGQPPRERRPVDWPGTIALAVLIVAPWAVILLGGAWVFGWWSW